jgi:hypothetical protein
MLMNHSDAEVLALAGVMDRNLTAVHQHAPLVGGHEPGCDLHQGSFAGAILPEQGVQLTRPQQEIGPAQCLHRAELFVDTS